MNLRIPPEPKDVKLFIKEVRSRASAEVTSRNDIDWDSLAVWYLSKLPSYLWKQWKNELEKEGYTWQKFLKVIKLHTNDTVLWALKEEISWDVFAKRVMATLERYAKSI